MEESGLATRDLQAVGGPLQIEQEVTLNWSTPDEVGSARARVAILLRTRAWLDLPHADMSIAGLEPGQLVRIGFQCTTDGYCAADIRFIEVIRERPLRIAVERPLRATRVQRRAFFRLRVHVPLTITDPGHVDRDGAGSAHLGRAVRPGADASGVTGGPGADDGDGSDNSGWAERAGEPDPPSWAVRGHTEDLGGGGLRFITHTDVQVHERVDLRLDFPAGKWLGIGAEVVRVEPVGDPIKPPGPDAPLGVALAFVRIAPRDQDRIVASLFECERRLRQQP
jgi:hypothetical protein